MTASVQTQYLHSQSGARQRRRRPAKKKQIRPLAVAGVILFFLAAGIGCWKGLEAMLDGVGAILDDHTRHATVPVATVVETVPTQSVPADVQAPVLSGVQDLMVYQNEVPDYLGTVVASDNADPNPSVTADSSKVQLDQPGEYSVTYIASDASGNTTQTSAKVTVLSRGEGFADMADILAAADAKLAQITKETVSAEQQVHDIYAWARNYLHYGNGFAHEDWYQAAYTMLTQGTGDCFGYFAVTKLLFERLDIPNIDVRKTKASADEADHFWSLVSVDGGETWYHFDATPRYGSGDDFCLVTDAFLDAYSESHGGSHSRDKELYPQTP